MMTKEISPRRRTCFFLRGKESDLDKGSARGRIGLKTVTIQVLKEKT
jgi:hypothetical protein